MSTLWCYYSEKFSTLKTAAQFVVYGQLFLISPNIHRVYFPLLQMSVSRNLAPLNLPGSDHLLLLMPTKNLLDSIQHYSFNYLAECQREQISKWKGKKGKIKWLMTCSSIHTSTQHINPSAAIWSCFTLLLRS